MDCAGDVPPELTDEPEERVVEPQDVPVAAMTIVPQMSAQYSPFSM